MKLYNSHSAFASYHNQTFSISRVSAFSFYLKKKTPAKEKQTRGLTPRPQQRRAALPNSRLSISCSAHSHANALELERVRARASCFASRSLAYLNQPLLLRRGYLKLDYEGRAESPVSTLQKFVLIPNLSLTHDKAYPRETVGRLCKFEASTETG